MRGISVIIPTWNSASTLEKSIRSALEQILSPLEVLVCDDGSTDESREIVDSINDSRVQWIAGAHSGRPAIPRNRGIRASRGEWLAFLDSDDEWLPEKLENQFALVNKMGCDASCSNAIRYVPLQGHLGAYYKHNIGEVISFTELIHNNYVICSSVLIKKDIVDKCNEFPEDKAVKAVEDYALWLRTATFTNFAYVNEPQLIYRDEPEASIRAYNHSSIREQRINVLKSFISWAQETNDRSNKHYLTLAKKLLWQAKIENALSHVNPLKIKHGIS